MSPLALSVYHSACALNLYFSVMRIAVENRSDQGFRIGVSETLDKCNHTNKRIG